MCDLSALSTNRWNLFNVSIDANGSNRSVEEILEGDRGASLLFGGINSSHSEDELDWETWLLNLEGTFGFVRSTDVI